MKTAKLSKKTRLRIVDSPTPEPAPIEKMIRLDLGCGQNKVVVDPKDPNQVPFIGVDLYSPNPDVRLDLFKFPWPWEDNSVSEIHCSHFLEHVPRTIRWRFMEEMWRIMKVDSIARIFVPSWKSERALGDMTHEPPAVVAMFFAYLNQGWREANKLTYGPYDLKCNFENQAGALGLAPDVQGRSPEVQMMMCARQLEVFTDMWVVLHKKPLV